MIKIKFIKNALNSKNIFQNSTCYLSYALNILFLSRHTILCKQHPFDYFLTAFCINYALPSPSPFYLAGDTAESIMKELCPGI